MRSRVVNQAVAAVKGRPSWLLLVSRGQLDVKLKAPACQTDNQEQTATKIGCCVVFDRHYRAKNWLYSHC